MLVCSNFALLRTTNKTKSACLDFEEKALRTSSASLAAVHTLPITADATGLPLAKTVFGVICDREAREARELRGRGGLKEA